MTGVLKLQFLVVTLALVLAAANARSQSADAAKGESLLRGMSQKLAAAQTFGFSTTEFHDVMKLNGEKAKLHMTREVLVRRPNGFWTRYKGDRDWEIWYDGKLLTGISGEKKVYIQHEMPPTLDETMDMLAMRFNFDLPVSDVLYSSPYDAFLDAQSRGGLVGKETINGSVCNHLAYTASAVDWQLWIDAKSSLPCRLEMTYKTQSPQFYRITFSKWDLSAKVRDDVFAYKIPQGYVRISMLERVLLQKGGATQTQTAPSKNP